MLLIKLLIVPDSHRPYHNKRAWDLMLQVGRYLKPDVIVTMGDFADFYSVSSFSKDPTRITQLDAEIADCNNGLDELDWLKAKRKVFVAGNHCARLERYLKERAPALFSSLKIEKILRLDERKWEYVPYKHDIRIGRIYFTHDVDTCARNSSFKAMDTYQHSIIIGHAHRMLYIVENDALGTPILSAQFGWLGDAEKVDYMHRIKAVKNWPLGFGIAYEEPKTGYIFFQPIPIVDYRCVVNGKLFRN